MGIVTRLLRRNLSAAQTIGFVLSNFIGIAIVIAGVQFHEDVRSIWENEDSFIRKDYLVVNKKVSSANTLGVRDAGFTDDEISDLEHQPWVRKVGRFQSADYQLMASMNAGGGRQLSTYMFFESLPKEFVDIKDKKWSYAPGEDEVPIIISKDYLTLYNFGFATSAGMPQITEQMMSAMTMDLLLSGGNQPPKRMKGRIVGYSNRLNTILVPQEFMDWSNATFGLPGAKSQPKRIIIDTNSPGDVAITQYIDDHNMEIAGDKSASQASYFVNLVSGLTVGVGIVITTLSIFILLLSISLLMQKNREKLHALIMQGYPLQTVGAPYVKLIALVSVVAYVLAVGTMLICRNFYIDGLSGMSGGETGSLWLSLTVGLIITLLSFAFNALSVKRKVRSAFYL